MNSLKVPLIVFAFILLALVGFSIFFGDPSGSSKSPSVAALTDVLPELGLSEDEIKACIESGEYEGRVQRDINQARELEFAGTPAVVLLDTQTNLGVKARGAYPFEVLAQSIQELKEGNVEVGDTIFISEVMGVELVVESLENIGLVDDDHIRGDRTSRILMIEYSDIDCPYCANFHGTALNLVEEFPEDFAWVYRHFPLPQLHPAAFSKAVVSECAGSIAGEDAFWGVIDSYYAKNLQ